MKRKKFAASLLALLTTLCLGTSAFAESSTTATVPVTLTVENQYRAVNVTVPASLPVYVINGTVVTADNACITKGTSTSILEFYNWQCSESAACE